MRLLALFVLCRFGCWRALDTTWVCMLRWDWAPYWAPFKASFACSLGLYVHTGWCAFWNGPIIIKPFANLSLWITRNISCVLDKMAKQLAMRRTQEFTRKTILLEKWMDLVYCNHKSISKPSSTPRIQRLLQKKTELIGPSTALGVTSRRVFCALRIWHGYCNVLLGIGGSYFI